MLYRIQEEYLEEYIAYKKLELGYEIVEHLCIVRDDTDDIDTKKFLQRFIDQYSDEYKVCKSCFEKLEPIVAKERFDELDKPYCREYLCGYGCECGKKYDY